MVLLAIHGRFLFYFFFASIAYYQQQIYVKSAISRLLSMAKIYCNRLYFLGELFAVGGIIRFVIVAFHAQLHLYFFNKNS